VRHLALVVLLGLFFAPTRSPAHELTHTVSRQEVTVITLHYADGSPFSYESYEVYPPGDEIASQVGRTDAEGRIAFVADRAGAWRVRAFSEDGHGIDTSIEASPTLLLSTENRSPSGRGERILVGLALIFGGFGILSLLLRRRKTG
jgi:nickel transport protein